MTAPAIPAAGDSMPGMTTDPPTPPVPPLVFTVAVTGHRDIGRDREAELERRIAQVLRDCAAALEQGRAGNDLDKTRAAVRRFVSAMAEGADRIAMRAARKVPGWSCEAILPFARKA